MASKPKTKTSKGRSARKAPARTASKKRSAKKVETKKARPRRAAPKRATAPRAQHGRKATGTPDWMGAIDTLITSPNGREVLASVLYAAADALRAQGAATRQAAESGAQQMMETSEAAADIGTEMASGSIALAQTAAGVLAGVATEAARGLVAEGGAEAAGESERDRGTKKVSSE